MTKEPFTFPLKELPPKYAAENALIAWGKMILAIAFIQWCLNTWRIQHAKWRRERRPGAFKPQLPVKLEVFNSLRGESCGMICGRLHDYGINFQRWDLAWELWPDGMGIGLNFSIFVSPAQADFADCILAEHAGESYTVISPARKLRGYNIGKPWGVRARPRSFDEALSAWLTPRYFYDKKTPLKAPARKQAKTPRTAHTATRRPPIGK